jgi:hypothetical protein
MKNSAAPTEVLDEQPGKPAKQPRHVAIAQRHLVAQRDKAIAVRDKADKEIEDIDSALYALGWEPED